MKFCRSSVGGRILIVDEQTQNVNDIVQGENRNPMLLLSMALGKLCCATVSYWILGRMIHLGATTTSMGACDG
eukprot:Nitzschia sp. Nitz4//scaffold149_size55946//51140//51415//NITZ4_006604-RA/size55946-exonerate_est2genome-gene-0.31-mRNA-1//1//CDS//3329536839//2648//frame0